MVLPHDDAGAGPAVVLIHAGVADRRMWREHLGPLADAGYRAVAVDLPAFGEAVPAGRLSAWSDVLDTLGALGIERAAFVGNSFGGAVALGLAVSAPELVSALLLVSAPAPGMSPSPQLRTAWELEEAALEREDLDGAARAVVDSWVTPQAPGAVRELVAVMQRQAFELQSAARELPEEPDPLDNDPEAVRSLEIPVLVVYGEHDMPDFRDAARLLARAIPGARHAVIAGAGHLAPLEQPDAFLGLMLEFLAAAMPTSRGRT